jgi:aspartate aminotransferase
MGEIMKLSHLSATLIGSEIVKLGGEIRERIRRGERIFNFTVGDFDPAVFPIPKELEDDIVAAYRQHFTNYPIAEGNVDLRESVSAFVRNRQGLDYGISEYLIAAGGRPLIYALFRAVADQGDKVVYAVPSWNNNHYTHFVGADHVVVETQAAHNFMPTAAELKPFLQGATLLALCSPQNPTGTTFSRQDLIEICEMVIEENERRSAEDKKLYVMFDQMYGQLTYGDIEHYDPVSLVPAMRAYTIYIDAISKVFAATGVRVGWAFGPEPIIQKMKAILTHVGAWAPMAEQKAVATYLQKTAAIDAYLKQFKEEVAYRLRAIYQGIQDMKQAGLRVDAIAPEAAIYLTIQFDLVGMRTASGEVLANQAAVTSYLLQEAKLAVVPFYAFGASSTSPWYRLSVGTCKKEEIGEMLQMLRSAIEKLQ